MTVGGPIGYPAYGILLTFFPLMFQISFWQLGFYIRQKGLMPSKILFHGDWWNILVFPGIGFMYTKMLGMHHFTFLCFAILIVPVPSSGTD